MSGYSAHLVSLPVIDRPWSRQYAYTLFNLECVLAQRSGTNFEKKWHKLSTSGKVIIRTRASQKPRPKQNERHHANSTPARPQTLTNRLICPGSNKNMYTETSSTGLVVQISL